MLRQLLQEPDSDFLWSALAEELYHQGDVGEASYAAVSFIVYNCLPSGEPNRKLLALVGWIEIARNSPGNPSVPEWLEHDYFAAIERLAIFSIAQLTQQNSSEQLRGMLGIIALWKGLRAYGRVAIHYSEDELGELLPL